MICTVILSHIFPMAETIMICTVILSHISHMAGTGKISIVMDINRVLNNINIEALSMMNPSSIVVHAIHQIVLLHKGLTKILLIQASSTRAQNFNALTKFSLNEAHKLSDTINVFSGKQSAMNPTPIHLRMHRRKRHKSTTLH